MSGLFDVILLVIAVYVLIAAIRGKGKLYDTQFIKDGKEEEYVKKVRIVYFMLSIVMIMNAGVNSIHDLGKQGYEAFNFISDDLTSIMNYIYLGLIMALLGVLIFLSSKYTDKEKKKNFVPGAGAKEQDPRQKGHTLPVSAFEFDDEPKKVESKKPAEKKETTAKKPAAKKTAAKKPAAKKTVKE